MTEVEITNLVATAAQSALLPGFTLDAAGEDEGLPWKPEPNKLKMWIECSDMQLTELSGRQAKETVKVTFAAYVKADLGKGTATAQTSALQDPINGPFRYGCVLRNDPQALDYLNGRAPSSKWIPGKDAKAYPGLFVACALVTFDHYFRRAAVA